MTVNLTLALVAGGLAACGVYLLLERSLTRVLLGVVLLGNGVNVMLLAASGPAGESAFYGSSDPADQSDPLPQALVLTAIVISLATVAFMLALAHRAWQHHGNDDVQDDVEDAEIRRRADEDLTSHGYGLTSRGHDDEDSPPEDDGGAS